MVEGVTDLNTALLIQAGEGPAPSPAPSSSETKTEGTGVRQSGADAGVASGSISSERAAVQQARDEAAQAVDEKALKETVQELNDKMFSLNRQLLFKVDKKINRNYISVIDKTTKEIIKEFPPEEIRRLMEKLREYGHNSSYSGADAKDLLVDKAV